MQERVDEKSVSPLYLRVRDHLAAQIAKGLLTPSTRLPSERILAEEHDTTRVTTRLALAQLEAEGRIYRSNRRGWFVSPPRLIYKPTHDYSFSENVTAQGRVPATETLDVTSTHTNSWLATRTGMAIGDPIVWLRRRRQIDGRPVLVENIYLNPKRLPEGGNCAKQAVLAKMPGMWINPQPGILRYQFRFTFMVISAVKTR